MRFTNRADAGRRLAAGLRSRAPSNPVVVGVVRGGVPVAAEGARGLGAPLDICVVRNLVVPAHKPVVIGAVAERRAAYLDPARIARFALGDDEVEHLMAKQFEEVDRLTQILRTTQPIDLTGRDV